MALLYHRECKTGQLYIPSTACILGEDRIYIQISMFDAFLVQLVHNLDYFEDNDLRLGLS